MTHSRALDDVLQTHRAANRALGLASEGRTLAQRLAGLDSQGRTLAQQVAGLDSRGRTLAQRLAGLDSQGRTLAQQIAGLDSRGRTLAQRLAGLDSQGRTLAHQIAGLDSQGRSIWEPLTGNPARPSIGEALRLTARAGIGAPLTAATVEQSVDAYAEVAQTGVFARAAGIIDGLGALDEETRLAAAEEAAEGRPRLLIVARDFVRKDFDTGPFGLVGLYVTVHMVLAQMDDVPSEVCHLLESLRRILLDWCC